MKKTFEDKMQRLEELNILIQNRETSLDDAVKSFDEGVKLAAELEKELRRAEKKVEILLNEPELESEEEPELGLFE